MVRTERIRPAAKPPPTSSADSSGRRPKAEARKRATQAKPGEQVGSSKLDAPTGEPARTDETVAAAVGLGKDTYRKAKAIVEAAEEDPVH